MENRTEKIIDLYAHDYRNMTMSQVDLKEMLQALENTLNCEHECTSECRRSGCNCDCGEFHIA